MRNLFLITLLSVNFLANAQEDIRKDPVFIEFEKSYITIIQSKDFLEYNELALEMADKMRDQYQNIINKNFDEWIDENLSKTKFESTDEAKKVFYEMISVSDRLKKVSNELNFEENQEALIKKYGKENFFENQKLIFQKLNK